MSRGLETRIKVHVLPGAPRNEVVGFSEGVLRVRIKAPPERGKANAALVAYLAERLGVRRAEVSIEKGVAGRDKILVIGCLSAEEVMTRLSDP